MGVGKRTWKERYIKVGADAQEGEWSWFEGG